MLGVKLMIAKSIAGIVVGITSTSIVKTECIRSKSAKSSKFAAIVTTATKSPSYLPQSVLTRRSSTIDPQVQILQGVSRNSFHKVMKGPSMIQ